MYAADREGRAALPIPEQFADVLETDIVDYIDSIRRLDDPSITIALQEARRRMIDENVIQHVPDSITGLGAMVAVDGGNNVLQTGAATQCFVLSVRYSLRSGFDVNFSMERLVFDSAEPAALMYGIRNALEIKDIYETNEAESFCIVDNSWVSLLQNINRTLVHYGIATPHDQRILESFLRPMLAHSGHFITALKHPRNIALSKGGVSSSYCDRYGGVVHLPDKVFLLGIMEAGEYTEPRALVDSGQGQLNVHTSSLFACHQTVESFYNADFNTTSDGFICSTYYKPHPWSPVKRIEFHSDLLLDGQSLFFQMLASIRDSMTVPTIQEPLEQFLVDEIVRRHTGRIPELYQTAGVANIRDFESAFAVQLVRRLRT
ncbi:hypothetical protein NC981_25085 [Leptolyngbya sp. DQ-M1]|uniref:hypothetical protein n=1 Tax=Leptolyngbya sp. DQ-M1 TaxID=2933920 RepID=UPI00329A4C69